MGGKERKKEGKGKKGGRGEKGGRGGKGKGEEGKCGRGPPMDTRYAPG